jgi:hypothetical protein
VLIRNEILVARQPVSAIAGKFPHIDNRAAMKSMELIGIVSFLLTFFGYGPTIIIT